VPAHRERGLDPERGGVPIPDTVKARAERRIRRHAERHFAGSYTRLEIRFRGQFCYIDAYTEPSIPGPGWPPSGSRGTREEMLERLRTTPTHLCRHRYFGDEERWGFAFYTYSHQRYEFSMFPSGKSSAHPKRRSTSPRGRIYRRSLGANPNRAQKTRRLELSTMGFHIISSTNTRHPQSCSLHRHMSI
jgi:hypothetical protein